METSPTSQDVEKSYTSHSHHLIPLSTWKSWWRNGFWIPWWPQRPQWPPLLKCSWHAAWQDAQAIRDIFLRWMMALDFCVKTSGNFWCDVKVVKGAYILLLFVAHSWFLPVEFHAQGKQCHNDMASVCASLSPRKLPSSSGQAVRQGRGGQLCVMRFAQTSCSYRLQTHRFRGRFATLMSFAPSHSNIALLFPDHTDEIKISKILRNQWPMVFKNLA